MQLIIDNLAATVIGALILLSVLALGQRSQESAIEAAQIDFGKTHMRQLIDVVEQDFNNIGSGMADPTTAINFYNTTAGGFDELQFYGLQESGAATPTPVLVTYRWKQDGTATLPDGSTVDIYDVERQIGSATVSFDNATDFEIKLRKDKLVNVPLGAIADSLALVQYIDVDIGMLSPHGSDNLLQQTRWAKRFRPINLDPKKQLISAKPPGS